jgi:hypothetical protein
MEGLNKNISIFEKNRRETGKSQKVEKDRLEALEMPIDFRTVKIKDYEAIREKAKGSIVTDKIVNKILEAIEEKEQTRGTSKFAEIENFLIKTCINLKDQDIDYIMDQLGKKFFETLKRARPDLLGRTEGKVLDIMSSRSIKSTISFIRERAWQLAGRRFLIGFNNRLDATRKIDLVEVIFGETNSVVKKMNFVQIKSSPPRDRDIEDIVKAHRNFVDYGMLNLDEIEKLDPSSHKTKIDSIDSIIAVGPDITNRVEIFNSGQDSRGAFAMAV